MIKIVCQHCKESTDSNAENCYVEINLSEGVIYFKCPSCKKTCKMKLYREMKPFPKMKGI
jgi:hypothetical protein